MNAARVIINSVVPKIHYKCRSSNEGAGSVKYQTSKSEKEVVRPVVPDDKVSWCIDWSEYKDKVCIKYTAPIVLSKPVWADPEVLSGAKWNEIDDKIDRRSHHGTYKIENGKPINPVGRTGISGRGLLGKWGPNHAADPIVTRWKRNANGEKITDSNTKKPILEFVCIKRQDTDEWAIPGGMNDCGESISLTLKREFMEEALNSEEMSKNEKEHYKKLLGDFFNTGTEIYKGYVDDPRNTDNAWMETIAVNFHDENDKVFKNIKLRAGDDAKNVKWTAIDGNLRLYASHRDFIKTVAQNLGAHW